MKIRSFVGLSALCVSMSAWAGGFQLSEFSATSLGRSFAGAGVTGDDYSAIAFNPAGMVLKGTGMQAGSALVTLRATASSNKPTDRRGNVNVNAFVPHAFTQYAPNERVRIGLGVWTPFGLSAKYASPWFGSDEGMNSKITVVDVVPTMAYQLTDRLSVGAGLILEHTRAKMTNTITIGDTFTNVMTANNTLDVGYNVGLMYQITPCTHVGVSYRSKTEDYIDGRHRSDFPGATQPQGTVSTTLKFPEHVLLTAYHQLDEHWGLSAIAKWTRWSRFHKLTLKSNILSVPVVNENWRNTWMFGLGADYIVNKNWTVRGGIGFDQAGVRDAAHRTARVPDSDRLMFSWGASYLYKDNWQFDLAYMYLLSRRAYANYNGLNANYRNHINVFMLQGQYNF